MSPCTAGEIRPLLADMIPGVDTSGMGTYEIMNLIKAMLKDQPTPQIVDRLKAMIPDATAPAMTLDEIMNTIRRRLTDGKTLAGYVDQTVARLKAMTNPDVTGLDEGLTLVEAKIKDANQIQAENASLHRILGRVKAKVNDLLLDPREKITDLCQTLDVVQAEYDRVKERAVKAEALTVDVHQRLCKALHVLVSTPLDQALDQIIRMVEARDYHAKRMLARLCPDVDLTGKTSDQVLSMIEAQHKTVTERLGTSYAREIELTRELAEVKTRLETAGRESADLARALHLAEDKINAQAVHMCQGSAEISVMRADMIDFLREERAQICRELGLARGVSPERVLDQIKSLRDSLLAVVGHPGGETLSLNAALSLLQSKVSGVALSLGLSGYASLLVVNAAVENLRKDRDLQARTIKTLTTNQDAQISAQYLIRTRLLTLLCEDPNRAKTMTTDEVVDLLKSKIAALALNLSLPETATLNMITERIQGMTPSALILRDLILTMGARGTMGVNEAMREATERIKGMREGMHDLLQTWS